MHRFRTKRTLRDFLASPFGLLLLLTLVVFLARVAWGSFGEYREAAAARAQAEARVEELAQREARLGAAVATQGSARAEEAEIREKLRMARPGEEVILIVPDRAEQSEKLENISHTPWWRRVLDWVIK